MKLPNQRPKIRVGQIWKKKDTGVHIRIMGSCKGKYLTKNLNGSQRTHQIPERTLLLFWEQI